MNEQNQILSAQKYNNYKTSHVLHLLLSILTAGLWVPVWLIVSVHNAIERGMIERKMSK
jgi:hypothetical protein